MGWLTASTLRKFPRGDGTPAKTTLFAGRMGWLTASTLRKFPQGIFANN